MTIFKASGEGRFLRKVFTLASVDTWEYYQSFKWLKNHLKLYLQFKLYMVTQAVWFGAINPWESWHVVTTSQKVVFPSSFTQGWSKCFFTLPVVRRNEDSLIPLHPYPQNIAFGCIYFQASPGRANPEPWNQHFLSHFRPQN